MQERFGIASQLRQRAQRDPEFGPVLAEDPEATPEELLGVELGEVTVRVVEEQPGEVVVVLPPVAASQDLTGAESPVSPPGAPVGDRATTPATTAVAATGRSDSLSSPRTTPSDSVSDARPPLRK